MLILIKTRINIEKLFKQFLRHKDIKKASSKEAFR